MLLRPLLAALPGMAAPTAVARLRALRLHFDAETAWACKPFVGVDGEQPLTMRNTIHR